MAGRRVLSINHIGLKPLAFEERMRLLHEEGVPATGIWFDDVKKIGLENARAIIRKYPVKVLLGAYVGFFNQATKDEYLKARMDDEEKIELAQALGIETVVALTGPLNGLPLAQARTMLVEGLSLLSKKIDRYDSGMKIGLESIHWKYQENLTYVSTLADALEVVKQVDRPNVGVMVDLYHIWQETDVLSVLRQARGKIVGCQVADWRPITRCKLDRVLMGDGCIPITELLTAVEAAGWDKWYDVEILSDELWKMDGRNFVKSCAKKFKAMCAKLPREETVLAR